MARKKRDGEFYWCTNCGGKLDCLADYIMRKGLCLTCHIWKKEGKNLEIRRKKI